IRSGLVIGIINVLMSFTTSPKQLFFLRMLNGAFAGFIPSAIALVATSTPAERVGRALALIQTGTAAGNILGPMIGGALADLLGIRSSMRAAGGIIWTATLLVALGVRERIPPAQGERTSPIQDLKIAVTSQALLALLVSTVLITASIQSLEPILTKFVPSLRQDALVSWATRLIFGRTDAYATVAGFIFSLPAIATVLTAPRWAAVGDRIGYPKLLASGLLLAGLLALPQSLVATTGQLIVLRFLYGLMTAAVQPSVNATLSDVVHPSFRGRAFGINTSAMNIGAVLGPLLGGYVADHLGPRMVFVTTGILLMVASIWVQRRLASRAVEYGQVGAPAPAKDETGS
ncbi:MAG TPA: MFS transporter, partial [Symbiobacteriaceae bacterium]